MLNNLQKIWRKYCGNSATERTVPNWIVQVDCFHSEHIIESLQYTDTPYITIDKNTNKPVFLNGAINIFRGSIEKAELYKGHPNVYIENMEDFDFDVYVNFIDNLLNDDYMIVKAGEVKEKKKDICGRFSGDRLFIRPVKGDKLFTGTNLTKKWFDNEIDIIFGTLSRRPVRDDDEVIFSSFKKVENECRLLVNYGRIVSYSMYEGGKFSHKLAADCLTHIKSYPAPFFTVDVCMDSGKIIEINSFSCAGLYDMDLDEVVYSVNDFFTREK